MKTKALVMMLLTCLLCCMAANAFAAEDPYELNNYGYRYVQSNGRGSLVFQEAPRGKFMKGHKYYDGDQIYVNLYWRESGYAMAYHNGEFGYVDASYINWGKGSKTNGQTSSSKYPDQRTSGWQKGYLGEYYVVNCKEWVSLREHASASSRRLAQVPLGTRVNTCYDTTFDFYLCEYDNNVGFILKKYLSPYPPKGPAKPNPIKQDDRCDLDQYEYRPVVEKGRGSLVFQKSPRGSFMKNHKFHDGDYVFVNVHWRQSGYAIAYENGEYGYVDASYIDW